MRYNREFLEPFYQEIKDFLKKTGYAEDAPIIPVSAIFKVNLGEIIRKIEELIPQPEYDVDTIPHFNIARSFDVNRPGTEIEALMGGVIGGSISQGIIKIGQNIEIRPGINKGGKYLPLITKVMSLYQGKIPLEEAKPGGLIAIGTLLDPSLTKADNLIGNFAGAEGEIPKAQNECKIRITLLDTVLGAEEEIPVLPLKIGEP